MDLQRSDNMVLGKTVLSVPGISTAIELNRILGVSGFTFYNDQVSDEVACILQHYESEGIIHVLPWHKLTIDNNNT